METKSYTNYDDKTYEKGPLADYHIDKLNVNCLILYKVFNTKKRFKLLKSGGLEEMML